MQIINLERNPSGAYGSIQSWDFPTPPDGFGEVRCDTAIFYEYNGFVNLETATDSGEVDGENVEFVVVIGMTPDVEAWEEWREENPEQPEPEPEPTVEERVEALEASSEDIQAQLAQADDTAIELYEANLAQQEINAAQDDALIELYELIGG